MTKLFAATAVLLAAMTCGPAETGSEVRLNSPPRILEESVSPARSTAIGNGQSCRVRFGAFIEDADVDDALTFRFYIDFDPENLERGAPFREAVLVPDGARIRRSGAVMDVLTHNHPRFTVGAHLVTLMVFDGSLGAFDGPGSVPPSEPIAGVDGGNPRFSTTFDWLITVNDEECR